MPESNRDRQLRIERQSQAVFGQAMAARERHFEMQQQQNARKYVKLERFKPATFPLEVIVDRDGHVRPVECW